MTSPNTARKASKLSASVKPGDCLHSISRCHGFTADELWDHPANAALKALRKAPGLVHIGDTVAIPSRASEVISGVTDQRHTTVSKVRKTLLHLKLQIEGVSLAGKRYQIELLDRDFPIIAGLFDGKGVLTERIPAFVKQALIVTEVDNAFYSWEVELGHLHDASSGKGATNRLVNLGYESLLSTQLDHVDVDNSVPAHALACFQSDHGLAADGKLNEATAAKLEEVYGS